MKKSFGRYIVADPLICHGKLTFKGTRILVADVLELVADGLDWNRIVHECHDRIGHAAIVEAINLAGQATRDHGAEYLKATKGAAV